MQQGQDNRGIYITFPQRTFVCKLSYTMIPKSHLPTAYCLILFYNFLSWRLITAVNDHMIQLPQCIHSTPLPLNVATHRSCLYLIFRFCSWAWRQQHFHNWPAHCHPSCSQCLPYRSLHGCRPSQVELRSLLYLQCQHTRMLSKQLQRQQ